jgi:hypothetical protein
VPVAIPLQPLLDEAPKDDLETHRELERGRRLPRQDPRPVEDALGENEEDSGLPLEHQTTSSPAGRAAAPDGRTIIHYMIYILYITYRIMTA